MSKIGVGIITYNRPEFLKQCYESVLKCVGYNELVIVNDGDQLPWDLERGHLISHAQNMGVARSKNDALRYLIDKGCEYLFLIEDDMIILDKLVFDKYVKASIVSGIQHFNYGPGSPFNRVQTIKNYDLHNRHLLDQKSPPNPRLVIKYPNDVAIALYEHTVAMFSFFTRRCIEEVGYIEEDFTNAWEHVSHTYNIAKKGMHPPFWWFADIQDSHLYVTEAPGAIDNSSIAKDNKKWMDNVMTGREIYKKKHGHYPNMAVNTSASEIPKILKTIHAKYATST